MSFSEPFPEVPDLATWTMNLVREIPEGRVVTYSTIAKALGHSAAARWVGFFLLHHTHDRFCPCHRVVRADGTVGRFIEPGEASAKRAELLREGVPFRGDRVDLESALWNPPEGKAPLRELAEYQKRLSGKVDLESRGALPRQIAGIDVSYPSPRNARAAYALVDRKTGELLWSISIERPVRFPYITGFLSFREIPVYLDLMEKVEKQYKTADLLLVDGSGVLHPRGAGVASHVGVVLDRPTIGVTKRLLCGRTERNELRWKIPENKGVAFASSKNRKERRSLRAISGRTISWQGQSLGVALTPTPGGKKQIYLSPGHRVDLEFANHAVLECLWGHVLPEPIYWADRISRNPTISTKCPLNRK